MSTLSKIGMILTLISGILSVIGGTLALLGSAIEVLSLGTVSIPGNGIGGIVSIVLGAILIFLYSGRIQISDPLTLGVLIIILGVFGGGSLATIGGILIVVDNLMNSSSPSANSRSGPATNTRSRSTTQ